jgi:putative PIN family toxin of toxin-antitoxin system
VKIVVDANVFISSFFWGGNPQKIFERLIAGLDELYVSREILDEIRTVLSRPKFHASTDEIELYMASIKELANEVEIKGEIKTGSRGKDDDKYIECTMASNANYIVSGDIHLLEIKEYGSIKIIKAKEYLDIAKSSNDI